MERIFHTLALHSSVAVFVVITSKVNSVQLPKVYDAPRGENITLRCPVTLTSEVWVLFWKKDGTNIINRRSGSDPVQLMDRYRLTETTSLIMTDIDRSDVANYTCEVALLDGSYLQSDAIQLFVTELLVSDCLDTQASRDNGECDCYIDGNVTSTLTCTALGFPQKPAISWKLDDSLQLKSSVVNLTAYSNNMTLACLAEDPVLRDHPLSDKRVCVYYPEKIHTDDSGQDIEPNKLEWLFPLLTIVCICICICICISIGICIRILTIKRNSMSYKYSHGSLRRFPDCFKMRSNEHKIYDTTETDEQDPEQPCESGNTHVHSSQSSPRLNHNIKCSQPV